eukprot:8784726-Karenia_brevis.AAC.1
MGDPHHDKNLRTNKATHPSTLKGASENMNEKELKNFAAAFRTWLYRADRSYLLVIPICRRERHRSIAMRELLYCHLRDNKD